MSRINVLPWRIQLKKTLNRRFFTLLTLLVLLSFLGVIVTESVLLARIRTQKSQLASIEQAIQQANVQIIAMGDLKAQETCLAHRKKIVGQLQKDRLSIVEWLNQLSATIPNGVHLTRLRRQSITQGAGRYAILIEGIGVSNSSISIFLKKLSDLPSIVEAKLKTIQAQHKITFDLQFSIECLEGVK
jgi:type IV pilus assembly protein PilN